MIYMATTFDTTKTYTHVWTKEQLIEHLSHTYNKDFQVVILPTSKTSADILIRDTPKPSEKNVNELLDEIKDDEKQKIVGKFSRRKVI